MVTATLAATETDGTLVCELTVENDGDGPVSLQFSDTQRAEFVVERDGETAWRWSDGRMFGQALGSVDLAPGETATFEGGWDDPPAGDYHVRGELVANDADAEATTTATVS